MKKFLLIAVVAVMCVFALVGCNTTDGDMEETMRHDEATATHEDSRETQDRTEPRETVENIEPTNPDVEEALESLMPDVTFDMGDDPANVARYTDDELRNSIMRAAIEHGYAVYDVRNEDRATVNNEQTVDVEQTLKDIREEKDMASTRFVLKGGHVNNTEGLEKVAEYQTPLLSKSEHAIHNMEIANQTLDGLCLRSGEEFSFVFFLGEVSEETGYEEGTIFVQEEDGDIVTEQGIGGGICQVASTLHAACLNLHLDIVERHPHSKEVNYIAEGKDATISGSYKDLKFINSQSYPIILRFRIEEKMEIVEIYKV